MLARCNFYQYVVLIPRILLALKEIVNLIINEDKGDFNDVIDVSTLDNLLSTVEVL